MRTTPKIRPSYVIAMSGSFAAYYMGAGFCSGQEVMQFFAAFGFKGFLGLALCVLIYISVTYASEKAAFINKFEDPYTIFTYFCGKRLGRIFILVVSLLLSCSVVMMTASAGANLEETLAIPNYAGRCVIFLVAITVCLGLDKIIDILSVLGPIVAIAMLIVAVIAIFNSDISLAEGSRLTSSLDVYKGGSTWFTASYSYGMTCVIANFSIFMVSGSRSRSTGEIRVLSLCQSLTVITVCCIMMLAQIMNIADIYEAQIPSLKLFSLYLPALTPVFSLMLLMCTYSASTLQLWTVVRKFCREGNRAYYVFTIAISIAAFIISGMFPFRVILNKLFMTGIVTGSVYALMILIRVIRGHVNG